MICRFIRTYITSENESKTSVLKWPVFIVWSKFIKSAILYISSYLRVWFITSMLSHMQLKHRFSRRLMITNMTDIPIIGIEKIRKLNNDWYQYHDTLINTTEITTPISIDFICNSNIKWNRLYAFQIHLLFQVTFFAFVASNILSNPSRVVHS